MMWEQVKQQYPLGAEVEGEVWEVVPYGVWVDLGLGVRGLLMVTEAGLERGQQTAHYFRVGQKLTAKVLWHHDERQQLVLTRKPARG